MKKIWVYFVVAMVSAVTISCSTAITPKLADGTFPSEEMVYPKSIGDYKFQEKDVDPQSGGSILTYRSKKNGGMYLDVSIYPVPEYWQKYLTEHLVTVHYNQIKKIIHNSVDRGDYDKARIIDEEGRNEEGYESLIVRGVFEMTKAPNKYFSVIYLTVKSDQFIKMRATYPVDSYDKERNHLMEQFSEAYKEIEF